MPVNQKGFTLIELVTGMVVLAIAMVMLVSAFLPMLKNQSQPVYQVRAAELGQSMLDEILSRSFDENSNRTGVTVNQKYPYCGAIDAANSALEISSGNCSTTLGTENSETYAQFDDVDDYNSYCNQPITGSAFATLQGLNTALYQNYTIAVCVTQAPSFLNATTGRTDIAKKIKVTVITPANEAIAFISYRSNY